MDFIQMPVSQGYKYLLVMIGTFTGWIEGFPTQTEKTEEVVKKLLHEIVPRFGPGGKAFNPSCECIYHD